MDSFMDHNNYKQNLDSSKIIRFVPYWRIVLLKENWIWIKNFMIYFAN